MPSASDECCPLQNPYLEQDNKQKWRRRYIGCCYGLRFHVCAFWSYFYPILRTFFKIQLLDCAQKHYRFYYIQGSYSCEFKWSASVKISPNSQMCDITAPSVHVHFPSSVNSLLWQTQPCKQNGGYASKEQQREMLWSGAEIGHRKA